MEHIVAQSLSAQTGMIVKALTSVVQVLTQLFPGGVQQVPQSSPANSPSQVNPVSHPHIPRSIRPLVPASQSGVEQKESLPSEQLQPVADAEAPQTAETHPNFHHSREAGGIKIATAIEALVTMLENIKSQNG